ncbi:MAG TPA: ribonuclease Y [Firmicutes bacterium]|nr:ribonuclease Y [Bacillota bacterium]
MTFYIVSAILLVLIGIIGFVAGFAYRKKIAEKEIGSAEEEATRILNDAIKAAETKKREAVVEAREEVFKIRAEADKEIKERRSDVQKQERRMQQKEEQLDRKYEAIEQREEKLNRKLKEADETLEEVHALKASQLETLEKLSGLTAEEAKNFLISKVEEEARHDAALKLKEIDQQLKEEADRKAREVIALAIQRCAADHASEVTVSVVPLPNDEMKGRIIGREGRNIRALENLTGVDLIIDDTPEAITLSSFDPVRREVARIALEKLISDGRIHPTRIEEMVEKAKNEVEATIKQEGERAMFETGVHGLHPELVKILGRMRYRTSYGQNVLNHSIEVAHIAGLLAGELGANVTLAKRAGLLHDIGKAIDHEVEGSHVAIGVELAKKYRENAEVIHAIESHHGDVEAHTVVACLVQAADAISAARPGARRENLEAYIKRLEKLEELAESFDGVEKSFAIQAGREIRIIVKPDIVKDDEMILLARDLAKKIEDEMSYPGQIKVHVVRETRAIEYAK